nr:MAG: hypothetical protein [Lokiarchaeota virus Ratatoskr Meg22_1012]
MTDSQTSYGTSIVKGFVGKNVTWLIGDVKFAQVDDVMVEYQKDVQIARPLGTERPVLRSGGRLVRWNARGNQIDSTLWAFAIGTGIYAYSINDDRLISISQNGASGQDVISSLFELTFRYNIDITWEMIDPLSKTRLTWILSGVFPDSIRVETSGRGYVKCNMSGYAADVRMSDERNLDDETIEQYINGGG